MILQYVSASAIARIRLLASPAALTNIPVSAEKEDHVSMGSTASERLIEICDLAACVLANEMIIASAAWISGRRSPESVWLGCTNGSEPSPHLLWVIGPSPVTPWPSQREFSKRAFELSQTRRHLEHHPGTNPPSFTAVVEEVTEEGGVILSESWCYPRGGGQPGTLEPS